VESENILHQFEGKVSSARKYDLPVMTVNLEQNKN
jgi:hypothetical protein